MSANKKIFKAVATVTVFSVITRTLAFIFKIYLSRKLGAEIMGLYQICLSVFFLFASFSASGLPTVLSRKTAEARALNPNDKGLSLLSATLILGLIIAFVTAGAIYALEPYLGKLFSDSRAIPLFRIMAPALITTTIYGVIRGWFWGAKEFTAFSITETIEEILRILFTLFFVSGMVGSISGSYGIALAFTISDVTVAIILTILFFAKGGRLKKPEKIKSIARSALPVTAMRVFGSLIGTAVAVILPSRLIASGVPVSAATADFGRIAGMANPLLFAPNAIISSLAIVLIPEMSENSVKKNTTLLSKQINDGIRFAIIISSAFMVIYLALGKEITTLLFNDSAAGEYLEVAAYTMLFMPINIIVSSSLNSIGLEKEGFFSFLAGAVFMIAAVYFLPRFIGVYAVAVANAASLFVTSLLGVYFLKKYANFKIGFLKTLLLVAAFIIPCVFVANNVYGILESANEIFALITAMAVGGLMYCALVLLFKLVDVSGFISAIPFLSKMKSKITTRKVALRRR